MYVTITFYVFRNYANELSYNIWCYQINKMFFELVITFLEYPVSIVIEPFLLKSIFSGLTLERVSLNIIAFQAVKFARFHFLNKLSKFSVFRKLACLSIRFISFIIIEFLSISFSELISCLSDIR